MSTQTDADSFLRQLKVEIEVLQKEMLQEVDRSVKAVHGEVAKRTPILTGRAKSSWRISESIPDYNFTEGIDDLDESTWLSESEALALAQFFSEDLELHMQSGDLYVSNGVHYIVDLENGSSTTQAPPGFMARGTLYWAAELLPMEITGDLIIHS